MLAHQLQRDAGDIDGAVGAGCRQVGPGGLRQRQLQRTVDGPEIDRIGPERTGSDNGAGLGLAIVASIVDVHAGTLNLDALPDGGLRVAISIPLAERAAGAPV